MISQHSLWRVLFSEIQRHLVLRELTYVSEEQISFIFSGLKNKATNSSAFHLFHAVFTLGLILIKMEATCFCETFYAPESGILPALFRSSFHRPVLIFRHRVRRQRGCCTDSQCVDESVAGHALSLSIEVFELHDSCPSATSDTLLSAVFT
jgi:hypothetical protein